VPVKHQLYCKCTDHCAVSESIRGDGNRNMYLFDGVVSSSDHIASNNELERILNKTVMTFFTVLSRRLPGGNEENHEKSQCVFTNGYN
jgi:hypothetical protein